MANINVNDSGLPVAQYLSVSYSNGTGFSTLVKTGFGRLAGIMVSSASGTILSLTVYDSTTATGSAIMEKFTPVAGTLYRFGAPVGFKNGLYLYSGGSLIVTVAFY